MLSTTSRPYLFTNCWSRDKQAWETHAVMSDTGSGLSKLRGVHLEEPSSPLQQQWSTSDLDEFVRQLTNPKHHISKVSSATPLMSPTSTTESCVSATTTTTTMMSPQRITVDSNSDITDLSTDFNVKCNMKRSHFSWRKSPDETSNSSSQSRFIFGRIRRTRQKSSEGDSSETTNMSVSSQGDDGIYDMSDAFSPKSPSSHEEHHVTFTCDSTPEGSDGEPMSPKPQEEVPKKDSKKRRFRKMLTRPLRRSHSAGCAKDIPAHALFLQHQGDTEVESIESRRVKFLSTSESTDCERTRRPPRPIHKTSSADAAMMAAEDLPSFSFQSKTKSRGLAKNMKKKLQFLRRRHTDTSLGVTLRGENGKICHINSEDIIQWSKSFEALLADKHGLELFKGFLKSEFSEENIEFWIACEQFKTTKTSKLNSVAHKIYTDFVAVQAPKEINLDSKTRVKTLGHLASVNRFMFEDAQKRVQALMEKDSYPRFIQSEVYQRLLTTPSKS